jgi:hypothetical protein
LKSVDAAAQHQSQEINCTFSPISAYGATFYKAQAKECFYFAGNLRKRIIFSFVFQPSKLLLFKNLVKLSKK